jgi:glutathione S-transferase
VHPVDVFGERQFKPEFLKLNPNAKVPVITDHDGPGRKSYTLSPFLGDQSYSIADIATFPWARGVGAFLGKPAEADYPS